MTVDSAPQIWDAALGVIRDQVSTSIFHTWFQGIRPGQLEPSGLVLLVPSRFAKEWLEPRYLGLITHAVASAASTTIPIQLEVDPAPATHDASVSVSPPLPEIFDQGAGSPQGTSSALNPRYSFDSYVIGGSNRFAHAAALAVAEAPARAYNPLFIYGGVGLGKTHLLHAIGHYVTQTQPNAVVSYVSSE